MYNQHQQSSQGKICIFHLVTFCPPFSSVTPALVLSRLNYGNGTLIGLPTHIMWVAFSPCRTLRLD